MLDGRISLQLNPHEVKKIKTILIWLRGVYMNYWVYILRCKDDTLYTGISDDVERRVAVHNSSKGEKYTRGRRPVAAVYREECANRSDALKRELAIKRLTRSEKLTLIASNIKQRQNL